MNTYQGLFFARSDPDTNNHLGTQYCLAKIHKSDTLLRPFARYQNWSRSGPDLAECTRLTPDQITDLLNFALRQSFNCEVKTYCS